MGVWYCTREDVKEALDIKESARMDRVIDRAVEAASRSVENMTRRVFYPTVATKYYDYPNRVTSYAYRQWLDQPDQLISVTSIVSGGNTLASNEYFLEPINSGPPYNRIEINLGLDETFDADDTWQRQTVVTGTWGYENDEITAETVLEDLDASETEVQLHNTVDVGVGSVIRIDNERMLVTARSALTTGGGIGDDLTASKSNTTFLVDSGTHFHEGETILIDGERMQVVDIAGDFLTVIRAVDGSVLAAHTTGATVYRFNSFTVTRGALGTTAATHSTGATVYVWQAPGPIRQLAIAEALVTVLQGQAGYGRTVGSGDNQRESSGKGLQDLRNQVRLDYGRRTRHMAV